MAVELILMVQNISKLFQPIKDWKKQGKFTHKQEVNGFKGSDVHVMAEFDHKT